MIVRGGDRSLSLTAGHTETAAADCGVSTRDEVLPSGCSVSQSAGQCPGPMRRPPQGILLDASRRDGCVYNSRGFPLQQERRDRLSVHSYRRAYQSNASAICIASSPVHTAIYLISMASPYSPFFTPLRGDPSSCIFRSHDRMCELLDISAPYDDCKAYAPYARNAPHCSRHINCAKLSRVPSLLDKLLKARIPSTRAGDLLEELSTHAVCGITGWHQNQADKIYQNWLSTIWGAYLGANGLAPELCRHTPTEMTSAYWEAELDIVWDEQRPLEDEDDDESSESEDDATDEESDYSEVEIGGTPDTTTSGFEDDPFDQEASSSSPTVETVSRASATSASASLADTPADTESHRSLEESSFEETHTSESERSSSEEYGVAEPDPNASSTNESGDDREGNEGSESEDSRDTGVESVSGEDLNTPESTTDEEVTDGEGPVDPPTAQPATGGDDPESEAAVDAGLLALGPAIFEDAIPPSQSTPAPGPIVPHGFRLYPQAPSSASQLKQLLHTLTQAISPRSRHKGYIYAYTRPSAPGHLKIGYVKDSPLRADDPVAARLARWQADCGSPATEVFRVYVPCDAAVRIESLVHLTLRDRRRVEDPPCRRCERRKQRAGRGGGGGRHDEWFEIDEAAARRVVELWCAFAESLPYDRFGRLGDFWAERAEAEMQEVRIGDTTLGWLETMPRLVEELTRWELRNIVGSLCVLS